MGRGRAPCCDKSQVIRGPWSPAEDLRLICYIQKYGHDNWRALPKQAGLLRCGKSCRLRWINYLRPDLKRGNFTAKEEETIIKLHESIGNKSLTCAINLSSKTSRLSSRGEGSWWAARAAARIFRSECIGILGQGSRERRRPRGEKRERPGAVQDENVRVLPSKTSIAPVKSTAVNPDPAYLFRLELCGISISIRLNLDFSQIRETAQPSPYKFIEFYDIRAAEAALSVLNRFDGGGKQQIKVELSRPSGARQCMKQAFYTGLEHDDLMKLISPSMNSAGRNGSVPLGAVGSLTNGNNMGAHTSIRAPISPFAETSFHHGVSNSLPKSSPSLVRIESFGAQQASPGHRQYLPFAGV
ncbi:unnamed protein product [Rhodiola kirilowii]